MFHLELEQHEHSPCCPPPIAIQSDVKKRGSLAIQYPIRIVRNFVTLLYRFFKRHDRIGEHIFRNPFDGSTVTGEKNGNIGLRNSELQLSR